MRRDYYVYLHVDPDTGECLYVGKGTRGRAWAFNQGREYKRSGCRDKKHFQHLNKLSKKGYLPNDWVKILHRGMTSAAALKQEKKDIDRRKPKFNKQFGKLLAKLTPYMLKEARKLRAQGWFYIQIAKHLNVSTMTVHRALNGKTKAYNDS